MTDANISNIDGNNWVAQYVYKKNGDMSSRTIQSDNQTFSYTGHQMTDADGNSLSWDENGNMKKLPDDSVTTELTYNWDNKLRHGRYDTKTVDLKYDPSGNRIFKDSSEAGQRKYIVDIVGDLPVILLELDTSNNIKKTYIYANSQIITQHNGKYDTSRYFYLHDRLGSVRQIIDTSGNVKNRYTYRPFGETYDDEGEVEETITNPFKFTGQYFDSEIDEYYLRARQYDPRIGRFTSRDPVEGEFKEPLTLHTYLYCQNEPINRFDPFGKDYVDINFTWTYGMVPGMLQGGAIGAGSSLSPVGAGVGAGIGMVLGTSGITGGVMFERGRNEAHFYLGPSWTTNLAGGFDFTMSICPSPDTTVESGWHYAISGYASGAYTQRGKNISSGNIFQELGVTSGTSLGWGASFSIFYVFSGMQIPYLTSGDPRSAFRELSLLDRAIMMNEMREDTGELMRSDALGRGVPGAMADIAFTSYYGVTADMLLGM